MRIPSLYEIKQKVSVYCDKLLKANWFVKLTTMLILWPIALIPFLIYILFRIFLEPVGFWQELALLAGAAILLGWLQIILLIFAVIITLSIVFDLR